jgi:para-aminobenzoate synthetase component 1
MANPVNSVTAIVTNTSETLSPETLVSLLAGEPGVVLLRSHPGDFSQARFSFVAARPFLTFRSHSSRCEITGATTSLTSISNPWLILDDMLKQFELEDPRHFPFPLGGCFGYWGYDLKYFVEPKLQPIAIDDLGLPDCHLGFYDSLVVFDHLLNKTWIVSTGLSPDGSRDQSRAHRQQAFWQNRLQSCGPGALHAQPPPVIGKPTPSVIPNPEIRSNFTRSEFHSKVACAGRYIRSGDIYQVNLSQRLAMSHPSSGWEMFQRLAVASPAPFAAYLDCGEFQLASSSPELFLRLSGAQVLTRPIKGTRPRNSDPIRDAALACELLNSPKETAELVMITDLLRNDLGRICACGSVLVPDLMRLERYAQVQHLVSTITGQLRTDVSHVQALARSFPGGSITGAPKFRAMQIIEELEPVRRGPYTGCLGYVGFNRESQLSIIIRTALCLGATKYFQVGAGIVSDSDPEAEYEETMAKAEGFIAAFAPIRSNDGLLAAIPDTQNNSRA